MPERGRPAQLDEQQLAAVRATLLRSPTEYGFGTELWTLKRVGAVIERLHGVRFGQTQVWRILGSLGFSPQKPEKRAIERNEDAVRNWQRNTWPWPRLKKSPARRPSDRLCRRVRHQRTSNLSAHLGTQGADAHHSVSLFESVSGQLDSRLGHCWTHAHQLLVPVARGQHQERRDCRVPQGAQGASAVAAVGYLEWIEAHRSRLVREYLDGLDGHIQIAFLPPYAPDMNPVEYLWAWLKRHALANYCPNNLSELHNDRTKQTQERSKAPLDHRRLLDAGYAVVMS